jgi:GNAT superfamily N-acetyltransferase
MSVTFRTPTAADIPQVGHVVYSAFESIAKKHNFPLDFPNAEVATGLAGAFLTHPKIHGQVAEENGKIIGANFLNCRNEIAGVGPMVVEPTCQGKGLGRQLMRAIIGFGDEARGIRLVQDAFNAVSMSLYTSLGFEPREPLALMTGKLRSELPTRGGANVRPMTETDIAACCAICERVHGFHRGPELTDALNNPMLRPHVLERNGKLLAYASAPWFWFLNHGAAESEQDLRDLLTGVSAASTEPLAMLVPIREAGLFRWLIADGMRIVKPMTLMSMRWYQEPKGSWYPSVEY